MGGLRLNLGCGPSILEGFLNVDLRNADICHDLSCMPWPWANESASTILASHILEHFDREAGVKFLQECYRILAPGGMLRIAVPDMDKFIDKRLDGTLDELAYKWTDLNYLMGGDNSETVIPQRHRYMYCFASLAWTLERVGFAVIVRRPGPAAEDNPALARLSLYVDALK